MSVKITVEVDTYDDPATPSVRVDSHWCYGDRVVLTVHGKKVTLISSDIVAAVNKATTNR